MICHAAYEDEQLCHLSILGHTDSGIEVCFSDAETYCRGTLNTTTGHLEGDVKQLQHGEEGFWVPSDQATHRFNLIAQPLEESTRRKRAWQWVSAMRVLPEMARFGVGLHIWQAICTLQASKKDAMYPDCLRALREAAEQVLESGGAEEHPPAVRQWLMLWDLVTIQAEALACKLR
eukprot:gene18213-21698_t